MQKLSTLVALLLSSFMVHAAGDIALPADKILLKDGRTVIDENSDFHVRTIRVQIPANKELEPHGPKEGYFIVTVISGTLQLGFGSKYDAAKLQTLPPGSIFTHPTSQQHFARTGNDPVVLQITSTRPNTAATKDAKHGQ